MSPPNETPSGLTRVGQSVLGEIAIPVRTESLTGPDLLTYLKGREVVRGRIRGCTSCPLYAQHSGPVPFSTGSQQPPQLCCVGEGPGNLEDRRGEPFVGKSGQLLRTKLRKAGFQETDVAYANTISCRPTQTHGRFEKDRTPTHDEMVSCRDNLFDQLETIRPRVVLLCGASATKAFRPDLKIARNHGRVYVWEQQWIVIPTYHPAAAIRNRDMERIFHDDIDLVRLLCKGEIEPFDLVSPWCTSCGEPAEFYDPNLAGFCPEHWRMKPKKNWPSTPQLWHMSTREGQWKGKGRKRGAAIPMELFDG